MNEQSKRWDDALQMPILPPASLNINRLEFVRWLVESGRMGREAAGPPDGPAVALIREAERVGMRP